MGQLFRTVKLQIDAVSAQKVRVGADHFPCAAAEFLIDTHGIFGTDAILGEEGHNTSQSKNFLDLLSDAFTFFRRNAPDLQKPGRLLFHDLQGSCAEYIHDFSRQRRPDALDHTGSQIPLDIQSVCRKLPLTIMRMKLCTEARMCSILPFQDQLFTLVYITDFAYDRNQLTAGVQVEHHIAVLLVAEQDIFHCSLQTHTRSIKSNNLKTFYYVCSVT